ncbi:hypothetical protein [Paenibacillus cremeus]|uniref:hypothetical protein n=1 Tax=Paenibacillus cremeus TaxID=2163881 RepID=UPI001646C80D|nr:hypothetical protein [Paenibacillus cremeus]
MDGMDNGGAGNADSDADSDAAASLRRDNAAVAAADMNVFLFVLPWSHALSFVFIVVMLQQTMFICE